MQNQATKLRKDSKPRRTRYFELKIHHADGGRTPLAVCNGGRGFVPRRPVCGGRKIYKIHVAKVTADILKLLDQVPRTGAAIVIYARDQQTYDELADWFGKQDVLCSA
jgi:hypothetical protein